MTTVTYHVEVIGSYNQGFGYVWHIFKNLEPINPDTMYIACIEFPNWTKDSFITGDKGYLTVKYVEQTCKNASCDEKKSKALEKALEWMQEKKINVSDTELEILIESAVNCL